MFKHRLFCAHVTILLLLSVCLINNAVAENTQHFKGWLSVHFQSPEGLWYSGHYFFDRETLSQVKIPLIQNTGKLSDVLRAERQGSQNSHGLFFHYQQTDFDTDHFSGQWQLELINNSGIDPLTTNTIQGALNTRSEFQWSFNQQQLQIRLNYDRIFSQEEIEARLTRKYETQ